MTGNYNFILPSWYHTTRFKSIFHTNYKEKVCILEFQDLDERKHTILTILYNLSLHQIL